MLRCRFGLAAVIVVAVVAAPGVASAHPLGNFTVNLYSGLRVRPDAVQIDLVVDMAEIPAFQARPDIDTNGDGKLDDGESSRYAKRACVSAAKRIDLTVDGEALPLGIEAVGVAYPPGTAGLTTLRLSCTLSAATPQIRREREVTFRNRNYDDRVGWREIVALGDGTTVLASSVSEASVSQRLSRYPEDLLQSPLDQRSATVRVRPGGSPAAVAGPEPPVTITPRGLDRFSQSFTRLVARQDLTVGFGLLAMGLAVALGAVHALAPGHGKTVMAAYLVGQGGSFRQAALVGLTMTVTHTAGVFLLGIVLSASTSLAAETLYPWLGMLSGVLLGAIGVGMLYRAAHAGPWVSTVDVDSLREPVVVRVSHAHSHSHSHVPDPAAVSKVGWHGLVGMGLVGGLLPSPSALVVLLGAIALGRAWFGVALVVAYGIGMAATLMGMGLLLVRARTGIDARLSSSRPGRLLTLARFLPAATALVLIAAGLYFAVQGAVRI